MQLCDSCAVSKMCIPDLSGHISHFASQHKVRDGLCNGQGALTEVGCAFLSELGKTQQVTRQHWQTVDWACLVPSSCASLYTKTEHIFCHLWLCWLYCFDSPKVGVGCLLPGPSSILFCQYFLMLCESLNLVLSGRKHWNPVLPIYGKLV